MGMLSDWFWDKGPVYLNTCARYPQRRERAKSEMGRIGVKYVESYDDGKTVMRRIISECAYASFGVALAMLRWLQSNDRRQGMWIVQDDCAFLRDVELLAELATALPEDVSSGKAINIGGRLREESDDEMQMYSKSKISVGVYGEVPFSWGLVYLTLCDTCRFFPTSIVHKYVRAATNGTMSIDGLRTHMFVCPSDIALSSMQKKAGIATCIPSARLCVQDYGCERGVYSGSSLYAPNLFRLDPECPSCFPDVPKYYAMSERETEWHKR